jgi:hypothetical protein
MKRLLFTVIALTFAQAASATLITTVSPSKANGTFIPGSGIPGQFWVEAAAGGAQVALAAHNRNSTAPVPLSGNTFYVQAGNDPGNATRAAWNADFQFTPAAGKVQSDYTYEVQWDIDPAFGATNFVTMDAIALGDSVFTNPGGGAWSDTTPFVIANSENYKFGFLAGPTFTNPDPGQYEIRATLRNSSDNSLVATNSAFVVVPEPASASLLGLAGVGLLARRRRRRSR